ncbi:MFS transporter [Ilumatobacter sp.]|uniref:MFS transporter n=1 Tax=Ilumatobacter sp. TaxID=1967498 RepID=UPI003751B15E
MTSTLLRSEPQFVRWATAEGVSMLGSGVSAIALPILVYQITGSAGITGLLFALRVLPYLCVGLIAGPIADRGNRRLLIIGGNIAEGLLTATIPLAAAFGVLSVAHIYVVTLLSATVFVFSDAAVFGAVPALVGNERLPAANGFLGALQSGSEIVGPALAGILIAVIGAEATLWVDAASFFVAAGVQLTIRSNFRTATDDSNEVPRRIRDQLGRAFRFIRGERTVSTLLVAGFGNSFAFGIVLGLLVPYAVEELGLGSEDGRVGALFAALNVGSMIAGLLFARIFDVARIHWLTPLSLAGSGVIAALLSLNALPFAAIGLLVVFSTTITFTIIVGITYRQLSTTDDLRSTVNVIGRMIAWGGQPLGAAVGALVASIATVAVSYRLTAAAMIAAALFAWLRLPRIARPPGDPATDSVADTS